VLRCCYALFVGFLAAAVRTNTRLRTLVHVVPGVWGGAGAGAQRSGQAAHCGDEGWARGSTLASPVFLRSNRLPTHASNRAGRQVFAPAFQDGQVGPGSWPQSRQQVHTVPYSECCWCRPVGEVLPAVGSRPAVPARTGMPAPETAPNNALTGCAVPVHLRRPLSATTPGRLASNACPPVPACHCLQSAYCAPTVLLPAAARLSHPLRRHHQPPACASQLTSALSECGRGVGRTARSAPEKSNTAGPPAA